MSDFTTTDVENWVSVWPIDYSASEPVGAPRVTMALYLAAIAVLAVGVMSVGYQMVEFATMVSTMDAYR